jgi:hypothetical protein
MGEPCIAAMPEGVAAECRRGLQRSRAARLSAAAGRIGGVASMAGVGSVPAVACQPPPSAVYSATTSLVGDMSSAPSRDEIHVIREHRRDDRTAMALKSGYSAANLFAFREPLRSCS